MAAPPAAPVNKEGGLPRFARRLRGALDALYLAGGVAGAVALVGILVVVFLQMAARWTGIRFPGSGEYAGYAMAAASFLAFAHAFDRGVHIRVSLVLARLGRFRFFAELWCFAVGTGLSFYFAWYAVKAVRWSYRFGDVSQGQDATPLWIPQLAMAAGAVLLGICFLDHLVRLAATGESGIRADTLDEAQGE
ncbi:TRAP transporter small permease [Propylenella binzhouense]|uniref:TRAP transporter small permease protein n=1 Tax=Propylenella binzhouense TaxID=2555902 RepID=A0A964T4I4_9HYPH|nr:TRAP transporter small permease [Propylenella binzhouense]MYZ48361.1 TRAP transporter small permease [Propylenella binzhouense]